MSFSRPGSSDADDTVPAAGDHVPAGEKVLSPAADFSTKQVNDVMTSEIGISTLLACLKQSIASAKEFAGFLKKRAALEQEHSNGLKKISTSTIEAFRKPEHRHGTLLQSYEDVHAIHERMADNGAVFASSLTKMHDDLMEVANNNDRSRKQWKSSGLAAENRVSDAEAQMRKSKAKYDSLAEEYDRVRTGDRQEKKIFGLKGVKSAAQHEEDLLKKVQAADADYASRVQNAQTLRAELLSKLRPEAVHALEEIVKECDAALTLQMQKFASFNEKLLLSNGMNVSPIPGVDQSSAPKRSMRDAVYAIDNLKDLRDFITRFAVKVRRRASTITYERNAVLNPTSSGPILNRPNNAASLSSRPAGSPVPFPTSQQPSQQSSGPNQNSPPSQSHQRSVSQGTPLAGPVRPAGKAFPVDPFPPNVGAYTNGGGAPQLNTLPFQTTQSSAPYPQNPSSASASPTLPSLAPAPVLSVVNHGNLPPLKPVFGLGLEELFHRDGSAVPMVVYQCIQAVDLYGLEVEGIYRLSGTSSHISTIKAMFDNDASKIDFRNPENFMQDVNSVAGLLKLFFRELPDPLLTAEQYPAFIEAAKQDDDIQRRDSLHAIINGLPDSNYATLRALTLHLNRVQENSGSNRMNASNLAIVFGPTLMGASTGPNIQDAGWQVRVIDTILQNTYQIFDDD